LNAPERAKIMNRHIFIGITGLLMLTAICFFWGVNQTIADTQTSVNTQTSTDIQTAIDEAHKTGAQRRHDAQKRLEDALNKGMGPVLITDELINEIIPMGTAPLATAPNATAPNATAPNATAPNAKTHNTQAHNAKATNAKGLKTAAVGTLATLAPPNPLYPPGIGFNPAVDYTLPNFSYSPNIRKFRDSLPGLSAANKNNLGQYIPVAHADTTTYPGSDFYDIACGQFPLRMSSDLNATTTIRGYKQMFGTGPGQSNDPNVGGVQQYLGPAIIAEVNRPVRILFRNQLPLSNQSIVNGMTGQSDTLALPVDKTIMGAGMGPTTGINYTDNRVTIPHLHGGHTPWISDGTTHQWITPAGDTTPYQKGVSFQNVPDMIGAGKSIPTPAAGDGNATGYYSNQQSARLMFYHDHAYGTTRLNVYAGVAAPYLLVDQVEKDLIAGTNVSGVFTAMGKTPIQILPDQNGLDGGTGLYHYGIPLVIQDKAFVNDANAPGPNALAEFPAATSGYCHTYPTSVTDPLWYTYVDANGQKSGSLWIGHEYMPIENIFDPTGNTPNGRWDYAPFMIPPMVPTNLTLPSPTLIPEAFADTAIVNGCAFPYVELPPDAIRFRILGVGNDRVLNLSLFKADPLRINVTNGGSGYDANTLVTVTGNDPNATYVATANVSKGEITDIATDANNYISAPTVTITGNGTGATAVAYLVSNSTGIVAIAVTNGGSGYSNATVTLTGGGGGTYSFATATVIPAGIIKSITVTNAAGFRSDLDANTVVTITDPNLPGTPFALGAGATAKACINTEVKMVDASPNPAFPTWPTDGRDGGVPDPTTKGPDWMLIGSESGFLAQETNLPAQPINFEYNRQSIPLAGMTDHSLLLLPAQRVDVVVDFSGYKDGDTLILYNDAPAPAPNYWAQNDFYTDDPNLDNIMRPSTPPGFGPNIRTVMQIRIKGPKISTFNFDPNALKTALPKAFAISNAKPIVPQMAYNDAFPGFATSNIYAQAPDTTLNVTGAAGAVTAIRTTAPGNNYAVAPTVTIVGGGGTGATATAGLNPCGGITLLTTGSGYTTVPAVTIGPPLAGGVQATAVATISGGQVQAINMVELGSNYDTVTAPTVTIAAPTGAGGVTATASAFVATTNTVGSITVTAGGSGYTHQPQVYIVPAAGSNGMGASAVALIAGAIPMTGKNITEGFDPDYGRMDIRMGSTPNPLTPSVGAGMVVGLARYIDPPTEYVDDGNVTLWRIGHLGVDSHALHFHLFDVQVVNRVDWTNVLKPPYPDEIGWRETIRTNPMEDIIVAFRPTHMTLPFAIPDSNRLLDPTTPLNSTINFLPVAPPAGVTAVAQVANVMTNFGWEYVWHCHMLGHEENDFMRPLCMNVVAGSYIVPLAPTSVVATAANAQATVTFAAPAANGSTITGYIVTVIPAAPGSLGTDTASATSRTRTITGLTNGVAYTFTVAATSAAGTGLSSAPSNSVTPNPTAPGAPTVGTATPGDTNATVTFTAPASDGGSAILDYTVTSSTGGRTATGATSPLTVTGLTNGTGYTFTVTARNAIGTSAPSAASNRVIPGRVPGAPTIGTATAGNTQATVSFTAPASSGTSAITSYTVTASTGGRTATGTTSPITVTGLTNGTPYTFTVTATNAVGTGPASAASNSVTPAAVPGAPTIGTATPGDTNATVTFTAPASDGGSAIISYTVTSTPGSITATGATSPITVTGLTNGTGYTFTVTALNGVGTSAPSAASNRVVPGRVPGAPTIGTATAGNAQATVTFTAPAANGTPAITSYTVTSTPGSRTGTGTASPITVTGLTNGTAYTFTVTATNATGTGPASAASNSVTPTNVVPAAPSNLAVGTITRNSVVLTWTDNATNETGFLIMRATNAGFTTGISSTTVNTVNLNTRTMIDLTPNTTYYYQVKAHNAIGYSAPSNVVTFTTLP